MHRKLTVSSVAVQALGLLFLVGPTLAGTVFELGTKDFKPEPVMGGFSGFPGLPQQAKPKTPVEPKEGTMTVLAQGHQMALSTSEEQGVKRHTILFDAKKREVTVVDHQQRMFHTVNAEAIKTAKERMAQMNPFSGAGGFDMQEMLKNVPADKRAEIEAMLKKNMPGQFPPPNAAPQAQASATELKKTKEKKEINGFATTTKVDFVLAGKKRKEVRVAEWSKVEGGKEVADLFGEMGAFFQEMTDAFSQGGSKNQGGPQSGGDFFQHIKELGGFPVLTKEFADDGSLEGETGLRSAKRQNIDPDAFKAPSGYKRMEMFRP